MTILPSIYVLQLCVFLSLITVKKRMVHAASAADGQEPKLRNR